jgi:hypothetical protein
LTAHQGRDAAFWGPVKVEREGAGGKGVTVRSFKDFRGVWQKSIKEGRCARFPKDACHT